MTDLADAGPAWLFCPGDRPERFSRARAAADIVIVDLEDAVAPGAKDQARSTVARALGTDLAVDLAATPLAADTGQLHSTGQEARMRVRFAAAAAGVPAIDTVRTDVADERGLIDEARTAAGLGFAAKMVVHPRQVPAVRDAFRPRDEEVAWARRVVTALDGAGRGAVLLDGELLDAPVVARARQVLARAR